MICPYCQSKDFVAIGNYISHQHNHCNYMIVNQDSANDGFTPIFIDWSRSLSIKADGSFYSGSIKLNEMKFNFSSIGSEENLKEVTNFIDVFMQNLKILS